MTTHDNNSNTAPRNKKRRVGKSSMLKNSSTNGLNTVRNESSSEKADVGFYRVFEERFRGPRDTIKERLKAYLPFITPLLELYQPANALDLGCGRGEWLELLREEGFEVLGVDIDQGMLQACWERDLPVLQGEAVSTLKNMDDESRSIVSGFHIAEHIPFEALQEMVAEALRVLRPGGLLILETPNPENIVVGTSNFYLDPTHRRPLPPDLLAFLVEYHGFARTKIQRLRESADMSVRDDLSLLDVLAGVSPDYAVVAQKKAPAVILGQFNEAFDREYGLMLNELAQRYSYNIGSRIEGLEHGLSNVSLQANEAIKALSHQAETQSRQLQEAAEKSQMLQQQLTEVTAHAAAEQVRVELLQPQLERAEQRIVALERDLADSRSRAEERLTAAFQQLETRCRQQLEESEKAQRLQQQLTEVATQAAAEQVRVEHLKSQLSEKAQALVAKQSELEQLHSHSLWLQNEWDAAKAKVDELNHSSHHWWTVADGLTHELRSVYRSKSWRITAPLRVLGSIACSHKHPGEHPWYKRVILSLHLLFDRTPALKKILLKVIALVPPLDRKLRRTVDEQLAQPTVTPQQPIPENEQRFQPAVEQQVQETAQLQVLSPHARRIYADLKRAMEQRSKGRD